MVPFLEQLDGFDFGKPRENRSPVEPRPGHRLAIDPCQALTCDDRPKVGASAGERIPVLGRRGLERGTTWRFDLLPFGILFLSFLEQGLPFNKLLMSAYEGGSLSFAAFLR